MTSSINKINKQGESTSVLINQQPQSYYAREDIAPVNASYANGYILLALCFMATAFGIWLMCTSVPCIRTRIRITNRLTTSLRILWSRCLERYNQIIETTKFSMKSWHKRELNYRLPIDFSRQSTIV
ncbi:unnamed protein product [Rotaria socialis]|uniref:Uncharacterized protein n=1 Tax=Rotaria socialis TaxID=392032 RepID=A0A818JA83_9BILA|nr:unnamed protein product [Rotaria socialis]